VAAQRSRAELLSVVEASYRVPTDTEAWLRGIVLASAEAMDAGDGGFALLADVADPKEVRLRAFVSGGIRDDIRTFVKEVTPHLSANDQAKTYRSPIIFGSMSDRLGGAERFRKHWIHEEFQRRGLADFHVLMAFDPSGVGCILAWARTSLVSATRRQAANWSRLAAHLTAGLRLRDGLHGAGAHVLLDGVDTEAILTPSGALAHATKAAEPAKGTLREAVKRLDRARSRPWKSDDAALELWRGLVAGRWSLVDVFDTDGKRFIVARRNEPKGLPCGGLTVREQQVLAYVAMGSPNKLIAYHLGLAESTVAEHAQRAMMKIGARSRFDIVRLFGRRP
jgi:DNA-binding CsgD family transcriptional regulator